MKRLLLSTKALWHQWRALRLARHARSLLDAADAHAAEAAMDLLASRSLARGPLPRLAEPDQQAGRSCTHRRNAAAQQAAASVKTVSDMQRSPKSYSTAFKEWKGQSQVHEVGKEVGKFSAA